MPIVYEHKTGADDLSSHDPLIWYNNREDRSLMLFGDITKIKILLNIYFL